MGKRRYLAALETALQLISEDKLQDFIEAMVELHAACIKKLGELDILLPAYVGNKVFGSVNDHPGWCDLALAGQLALCFGCHRTGWLRHIGLELSLLPLTTMKPLGAAISLACVFLLQRALP